MWALPDLPNTNPTMHSIGSNGEKRPDRTRSGRFCVCKVLLVTAAFVRSVRGNTPCLLHAIQRICQIPGKIDCTGGTEGRGPFRPAFISIQQSSMFRG